MGTGYIGFKGIEEEERPRLRQALREAHFPVEVVGEFVMVQTDDIVPVVEIYKRTCKSRARVHHVHLTDAELAETEREFIAGDLSEAVREKVRAANNRKIFVL